MATIDDADTQDRRTGADRHGLGSLIVDRECTNIFQTTTYDNISFRMATRNLYEDPMPWGPLPDSVKSLLDRWPEALLAPNPSRGRAPKDKAGHRQSPGLYPTCIDLQFVELDLDTRIVQEAKFARENRREYLDYRRIRVSGA